MRISATSRLNCGSAAGGGTSGAPRSGGGGGSGRPRSARGGPGGPPPHPATSPALARAAKDSFRRRVRLGGLAGPSEERIEVAVVEAFMTVAELAGDDDGAVDLGVVEF